MLVALGVACGGPSTSVPQRETSAPPETSSGFDVPTVPDSEGSEETESETDPDPETSESHESGHTEPSGPIPWIALHAAGLPAGALAAWSDGARSVSQAEAARQPVVGTASGVTVVQLDGVDDRLVGDAPGWVGDAPFTLVVAAVVRSGQLADAAMVGFGRPDLPISGAALVVDDYALHLATGAGEDARSVSGTFTAWFDRPVVVSVRRSAGSIAGATTIRVDGAALTLSGSGAAPAFVDGPFQLGGLDGFAHGGLAVASVVVWAEAFSDDDLHAAECAVAAPLGWTVGGCP